MSRTNRGKVIVSTLLLVAVLLSSCEQPYSTQPAVTNTPLDPNSFFTTPIAQQPDSMSDVEKFTTQTALASTPGAVVPSATVGTPVAGAPTTTATPAIALNPTFTATQAVVVVPTSTSAPVSSGAKPGTYVLKNGEFPYCIARRFNVDPDALLSLSGLSSASADSLSAGTVLTIPQSGSFPGSRALASHPTTYTVASSDETVYGVACKFGDIEPSAIAQANNISVDASLTAGQSLQIP
ncbi:MAG: LysM peptidoglycan-binding domain-containing protein [Anaerolineales bacterium]|nr:LysM peptidoglycan-binding domain-containing protein [Anaerolineales bacterium]